MTAPFKVAPANGIPTLRLSCGLPSMIAAFQTTTRRAFSSSIAAKRGKHPESVAVALSCCLPVMSGLQ